MECEFHCNPYKRRFQNYSRHEHLTTSIQPRKYSEDIFKMKFGRTRRRPQKYSEDIFKMKFRRTRRRLQKYSKACSTRLRRARELDRPGATELCTWRTYSRIRDGTWPMPHTSCKYSYMSRTSRNRWKLPK
jgi:hypothetical protein